MNNARDVTPDRPTWPLSLTQSYLETARSVQTIQFVSQHKSYNPDQNPPHPHFPNVILSFASIACIYSYMSIESYVNYLLHQTWALCRSGQESASLSDPRDFRNLPLRDAFAAVKKFEQLSGRKEIRELPERIKTICDIHNWRQLHTADCNAWQRFLDLADNARHFLIHPFPDTDKVQNTMSKILTQHYIKEAPSIAEVTIGHLYDVQGIERPSWLTANEIFTITQGIFPVKY